MSLSVCATPILIAAEALFAMRGYSGVSMQQIAHKAGTSKANIYHHFTSKDQLYLAVLKYALQDMNELLAKLHHIDEPITEHLAYFSSEHLKHINANSNISKLILREILDGDSSHGRNLANQVFSDYFFSLKQLLAKGQASGDIRTDLDVDHMATALTGLNVFLFQTWPTLQHLPEHAFKDQESSGNIMFELLLNGLKSQDHPKNRSKT